MFDHSDPVGKGILAANSASGISALDIYRELVDGHSSRASGETDTKFVDLAKIPSSAGVATIEWPAFPLTAAATPEQIDNQRWDFQDEYVEWRVVKDGSKIKQIVFTTELPEYYEALAEVSEAALVAGIQDAIPGATPTTEELFGPSFDPSTATAAQRAERFKINALVSFGGASAKPPNPWNNGTKGIFCLMQQFNTMGALFNLATKCAVPNTGPPEGQCSAVCKPNSCACGPNRNSDPRICTEAQKFSRLPNSLSLADAVGIHLVRLNGGWRVDGAQIDINDLSANQGVWSVDRNGRRGTLDLTKDVTVNGDAITSGTQVSLLLDVGADVVSVPTSDLLPSAAAGAPTRSMPAELRRMI